MSRLRVAPIVEGHGEVNAIRGLLRRIWTELLDGEYVEVIRPIRRPRTKLIRPQELKRAVRLAVLKLGEPTVPTDRATVLILLDADKDAPCLLGPKLLEYAREARGDADIACVLAKVEYETWFVAAADSLRDYLEIRPDESIPSAPEEARCGKGWIARHFKRIKYAETLDQAAMTAAMDLSLRRNRSPSFDKLCRELEKRLSPPQGRPSTVGSR